MPAHPRVVGTIPGTSVREVLRWQLIKLPGIPVVSDGELDRPIWMVQIMQRLLDHPDLVAPAEPRWTGYPPNWTTFRVKPGRHLTAESLRPFFNMDSVEDTLARLDEVVDELGLQYRPRLMVGMPEPLDFSVFTLGNLAGFRYERVFRTLLTSEIARVQQKVGSRVVFQLETPLHTLAMVQAGALRGVAARFWAGRMAKLARSCPAGTRFGVHLCFGDINHESRLRPTSLAPLVALANALAARWPASRPLEFIHMPFTGGQHHLPLDPAYYAPLGDLRLPPETRLIAGMIEESQPVEDLRTILSWVTTLVPTADVAAYCGLGRRDWLQVEKWAELTRELLDLQLHAAPQAHLIADQHGA